ncbi:MAG TPA: Fic family protein [Myxococcota bacterium]|nr:Fic family protein [Myxococcota bacterium]
MLGLDSLKITPDILRRISTIDEFKGAWMALGRLAPERLSSLRRVATIESVGSSTRIEGVKLTNAQIEGLLRGLQMHSFRSRDEQEVAGYAEAMELIFHSWSEIGLTENHIKQLHGILLKYSDRDQRHRGQYKSIPNHVEAFDQEGRSIGVIFETATPFDTPRMMFDLISDANALLSDNSHHPLLIIAAFIVRFLAIHPFQDGNGRLSRALTTLLLLRSGYGYVPYSSLERVIEDNKDAYYMALRTAQVTIDRGEDGLPAWIEFFLTALIRQKQILESKLQAEQRLMALPELSVQILEIARNHGRVTLTDACSMTGANRNTIKHHIKALVQQGLLSINGKARGTWYEPR